MLASPLPQQNRILILDFIRGVAVCGILILNMAGFSMPEQWFLDLNVSNHTGSANLVTWYLDMHILEGSYRALFSMLFGATAILLTSRLEKSDPGIRTADVYYRRLIWLLIFGLFNAYVLLWVGDILYGYAICGLFIFPLRNISVRLLITLAVFFVAILMFKNWLARQETIEKRDKGVAAMAVEARKDSLNEEQKKDLASWKSYLEGNKLEDKRKKADEEISGMQKSYTEVWAYRKPLIRQFETIFVYDEIFFDAISFMLLGMAFFRMGILTGEKPLWVYAAFVLVGYTGAIAWGIYSGGLWRQANFEYLEYIKLAPLKISLYHFRRLFLSMGHLGVLVLLWKSGWFNWLTRAFANVGQMAFTNYLMQSVICMFFFCGFGFGYFGKLQRYEMWYVIAGIWGFQIIFSTVWLRYFRLGPLEWVWRSLTYWKKQPILGESTSAIPS